MNDMVLVRDVDDIAMIADPARKAATSDAPVSSATKEGARQHC
jgi:hypothetical protein